MGGDVLEPGESFAGFVIERELGRGGMGSVYLARHPRLPRWIALKLLNPEFHGHSQIHARFEREADLAARLNHPGIVTVYDRGAEHGRLWIAMQYVDGVEAEKVPDMSPARAVEIVMATADALDYAHRVGVLHRDVKPANILLARETREQQAGVVLTDFGIARLQEDTGRLTGSGSVMATIAYASPEQLQDMPVDHRSDQYSLACTLFRLLTGAGPYPGTDLGALVKAHLYDSPRPLASVRPDLPSELDAVLARALAKRSADRYPSCSDFAAAALRVLDVAAAQPPPRPRTSGPPQPEAVALSSKPRVEPVAARSGSVGISDLLGADTGRHTKVPAPEPPRRVPWKGRARAAVFIGVCLAAALALALFLTTPSGRSAKPKPVLPEITEMSTAFPGLVPATGSAGAGFQGSTCQSADHETADFKPREAFSGWVAAWYCTYSRGHDVQEFQLLAFRSAASARWAASQVRPFASSAEEPEFTETCGGKSYSNYRFDGPPDKPSMIFATSFFDDPRRETVLLYTHGESDRPSAVVDWWKSLPLS